MYVEFKPGEKYAGNEAETSDNLSTFNDAGYVLKDKDLIVDIDALSHQQIVDTLDWFNIKTEVVWTDRGAHIYFNKPTGFRGARGVTDLGFEVEYKHTKNTNATTVKRNGEARKTDNHGERMDLPDFLKPDRNAENLLGLGNGDGRNNKLFTHRNRLKKYSNWREIMQFINENIFAEPLEQKEMDELTRGLPQSNSNKSPESIIAAQVANELSVKQYLGLLWYRENSGEWYKNDQKELRRLIYQYVPDEKTMFIEEVYKQLLIKTRPIRPDKVFDIKLNNGILRRGKFIDIETDDFTPFALDIDYDPTASSIPLIDGYLDNLANDDPEYRKMIEEILGYTLFTDPEVIRVIGKFFFFVGDGGNGKGTLLEIIRGILGEQNCAAVSIDQLIDERYSNDLIGKMCNLGDDIEDKPLDDKKMKMLKNISTADRISLRRLYESAQNVTLTSTLIFTSNHILKSFEKGFSYQRRVVWCPMYKKPEHPSDTFITDVTTPEAIRYWMKLMVNGYERLYKAKKFTKSKTVDDFNAEYHEENNSVIEYLNVTDPDDIVGKTSPDAYEQYQVWADENDYNEQSKKLFKETLSNEWGMEFKGSKVNGKTKRIFTIDDQKLEMVKQKQKMQGIGAETGLKV